MSRPANGDERPESGAMPAVAATRDPAPPAGGPVARALKRLLDVGVAAAVLLVAAVPMALVAAAIRLTMGSPVLFGQARPGRGERLFTVYKFRTMTDVRDADGNLLPDGERLTQLGRFLRRSSLDELPQLFNVLRGDMSLVGPRPLLERYLPYYTERERLRFRVPPGITGLAQVSGRNRLGWDERLELDAQYVEQWSLWLDVRILGQTPLKVIRSEGVVADQTTLGFDLDVERQGATTRSQ